MAFLTMLCIYAGAAMVLTSLEDNSLFQTIIPAKIIELIFYVFFILLLFSTTVATIGNTYSSPRMLMFFALPLPPTKIYFAKLMETFAETSFMYFIFSFPLAMAYIHYLKVSYSFLVIGFLVSIPFLLIPAGLSMVFATLFVRCTTLFWKRGLTFFSMFTGLALWMLIHLYHLLTTVRLEHGGTNAIVQMIGLFDNPSPRWLPSRWAADVLCSYLGNPLSSPSIYALLLFSTAAGAVASGFLIFDLFSLSVRSSSLSHEHREITAGVNPSDPVRAIIDFVFRHIRMDRAQRALIVKDLTSLLRDRAQSFQLLLFLGISVLYILVFNFMTAALNLAPVALQAWYSMLRTMNVIFAGIILTTIMTRLVYPAISLEGKAFWILTTAPIRLETLLRAKFWCWLPITLFIGLILLLSGTTAIGMDFAPLLLTTVIGISLSIGFCGLAVGIGSIFASFDWESPNQLSSGLGTLVLLLSSLALLAIIIIPSGVALSLATIPTLRSAVGPIRSYFIMSGSMFFIMIVCIGAAYYACRNGVTALNKLGE